MLKQGLELKQQQKLSQLQIQTIKLIELPVQELEQRIRKELEENPVLDEDVQPEKEEDEAPREVSLSEYKEDDSIPSYRLRSDNYNVKDERPQYSTFSVRESFSSRRRLMVKNSAFSRRASAFSCFWRSFSASFSPFKNAL